MEHLHLKAVWTGRFGLLCLCILAQQFAATAAQSTDCSDFGQHIQSITGGTNYNKFGYQGCQTTVPPTYYLTKTIVEDGTNNDGTGVTTFSQTTITAQKISNAIPGTNYCTWHSPENVFCTGTVSDYLYGSTTKDTNTCSWLATTNASSDCWLNRIWVCSKPDIPKPDCGWGVFCWAITSDDLGTNLSVTTPICTTSEKEVDEVYLGTNTYRLHMTLSDPFTDDLLRAVIQTNLPPLPSLHDAPFSEAWTNGCSGAYLVNSADHLCAHGTHILYRFQMPNSVKNATYFIKYREVTIGTNGVPVPGRTRLDQITGTGDTVHPAPGRPHLIEMPTSFNTTITPQVLGVETVTVNNVAGTGGN